MDIMEKINKKNSIILIIIAAIVAIILALFLWLELGKFEKSIPPEKMDFISEYRDELVFEEDGIVIPVGTKGMEYMANDILKWHVKKSAKITSLYVEDGRVMVNFRKSGFSFPLSFAYEFSGEGDIFLTLSDMKISKNENTLSEGLEALVKKIIGLSSDTMRLENRSGQTRRWILCDDVFYPRSLKMDGDVLEYKVEYQDMSYHALIGLIRTDKLLAIHYKNTNKNLLADAIGIKDNKLTFDKDILAQIFISQPELIYDFLALQEDVHMEMFTSMLNPFQKNISIDETLLKKNREKILAGYVDGYVKEVFEAFAKHFKERRFVASEGRPFDLEEYKVYDVKSLLEAEAYDNSDPIYEKMCFVFWDARFSLAYQIDEDKYYIRGADKREFLNAHDYNERYIDPSYPGSVVAKVESLNKDELKEARDFLTKYFKKDEIFIRYIKKVGDVHLAILSFPDDYQNYRLVSFLNFHDELSMKDDEIKDVEQYIRQNPTFPAQLFPPELIKSKLVKVSDDTLVAIMDEMDIRGLAKGSAKDIKYASYDGQKYIYFVLKDGRNFVFKVEQTVFGTYLATVYEREKAFKNWDDINVLISLE